VDCPRIRLYRTIFPSYHGIKANRQFRQHCQRDRPAVAGNDRPLQATSLQLVKEPDHSRQRHGPVRPGQLVLVEDGMAAGKVGCGQLGERFEDRPAGGKPHFLPHQIEIQAGIEQGAVEIKDNAVDH